MNTLPSKTQAMRPASRPISGRSRIATGIVMSAVSLWSASASAFDVVPRGDGKQQQFLKWGSSPRAGTSGGTVTWGFVADQTPGSSYCAQFCPGPSVGVLPNFYPTPDTSNATEPLDISRLAPIFQAAFDAWSAVADIRFHYVGIDDSKKAINDASVKSPMVRIGIWRFSGLCAYFTAGAAFPPGLRDNSTGGHIFINANVGYQLSNAAEGARLQDFPSGNGFGFYMTDLYELALHEIGHVIGLAGSDDPEALMWQPTGSDADPTLRPTFMVRKPRADDIAGARFLYGPSRSDVALASGQMGTPETLRCL